MVNPTPDPIAAALEKSELEEVALFVHLGGEFLIALNSSINFLIDN